MLASAAKPVDPDPPVEPDPAPEPEPEPEPESAARPQPVRARAATAVTPTTLAKRRMCMFPFCSRPGGTRVLVRLVCRGGATRRAAPEGGS